MTSKRKDKRGHWPAGKRRHAETGQWSRTRLALTKFLDDHYQPGVISRRALGAAVGVSEQTVRNYLSGLNRPPPDIQDAIAQWLAEQREALSDS